jgi:hypothetical protein
MTAYKTSEPQQQLWAIDDQSTPFLLQKLTVAQLVKFPALQGARKFITVLTTGRPAHLILP